MWTVKLLQNDLRTLRSRHVMLLDDFTH